MSPTISGEEREALYCRAVVRLNGIDALNSAIDEENFDAAHRLAQEFSDLLRLLWEDLGWGEKDIGSVTLSTPPDVLARAAGFLRELARADRRLYEDERWKIQERVDEVASLEQTCERLIGESKGREK